MRAVLNNDTRLRFQFDNADGDPTDATGSVTVAVTRAAGTALTGGTATSVTGYPGLYEFTLDAVTHASQYDTLTVQWSAEIDGQTRVEKTFVDIVGGRLITPGMLRSQGGLADKARYTNDLLNWVIDLVSDSFDEFTETAWKPRYRREKHDGDNSECIYVRRGPVHSLVGVKIDGVAADLTGWVFAGQEIRTDGDLFVKTDPGQNIEIGYTYGVANPPASIVRAAVQYGTHLARSDSSTIPDRARMVQTEWGMFIMDTASEDKPTGLPEVDSVLVRNRRESAVSFA